MSEDNTNLTADIKALAHNCFDDTSVVKDGDMRFHYDPVMSGQAFAKERANDNTISYGANVENFVVGPTFSQEVSTQDLRGLVAAAYNNTLYKSAEQSVVRNI